MQKWYIVEYRVFGSDTYYNEDAYGEDPYEAIANVRRGKDHTIMVENVFLQLNGEWNTEERLENA